MKKFRFKLLGLVTLLFLSNLNHLYSLTDQICSVPFFEDAKYIGSKLSYEVYPNTNMYLFAIDCFSTVQLQTGDKEIFMKQAVAELIRKSACYHFTQDYFQTIYVPSCISLESTPIDSVDFYANNQPGYYNNYMWVNHFAACDVTKWDMIVLHLQIVNGKVIILSNTRTPQICTNMPPTCAPSNNLLNTFTTVTPDWNVNPSYSTTMPLSSSFIKNNVLQTYTEGTKNINYMNIYEEYTLPNDLTWRAVVRKPQIRVDSDSLKDVDKKGLFKQIITKTILDIIDRTVVENGNHTVILQFPDLDIGDKYINYGNPILGGSMTFNLTKSNNGILLVSGTDNCNLAWIPDFGDADDEIQINSFLKIKNIEYLPYDYVYTLDKVNCEVGSVLGNYEVTNNGDFSYSIPLDIVPGTKGLQPKVNLTYNSQSNSGIAGLGWSISAGQSGISRCPKYQNLDATNSDINYDIHDKLVFNGTKLVLKNPSASEGVINTVYIPEIGGDIAKVTLKGGDLNSSYSWFLVELLDGTKIEYGRQNNSQRKINDKILSWEISRVIDHNGNFIQYNYRNQGNDKLIESIKYTGHLAGYSELEDNVDVSPYAEVKFYYHEKPDISVYYTDGSAIKKSEILTNIQLIVNNLIYKQYNLYYENKSDTYLKKIEEVGQSGSKYNASVFNYNNSSFDGDLTIENIPIISNDNLINSIPANYTKKTIFGDFNGDGFLDRVTIGVSNTDPNNGNYVSSIWYLQLGEKSDGTEIQYGSPQQCNLLLNGCTVEPSDIIGQSDKFLDLNNILVSDLNNDGYDEIVVDCIEKSTVLQDLRSDYFLIKYDDNTHQLTMSSNPIISNVYNHNASTDLYVKNKNRLIPGDFDGDGFTEIAMFGVSDVNETTGYFLYFFDIVDSQGNFTNVDFSSALNNNYFYRFSSLGTSGLWPDDSSCTIINSSYENGKTTLWLTDDHYGKIIRFRLKHSTKQLEIIKEFDNETKELLYNRDGKSYYGDFNGDGNMDIYQETTKFVMGGDMNMHPTTYQNIYLWDGKDFTRVYSKPCDQYSGNNPTPPFTYSYCDQHIYVTDINGDGKDDILYYSIYTKANSNQLILPDYKYSVYMLENENELTCLSKTITTNDQVSVYNDYLLGQRVYVGNVWKINDIDDKFNNYKTQLFYNMSVSQSAKYDLTSHGKAGLYYNGKYLSFLNINDNQRMKELFDGYGNKLEISYTNINDDDIYTKKYKYVKNSNNSDISQLRYLNFSLDVVKSVKSTQATDPVGMNNEITYNYSGAVFDRLTRGFLGCEGYKSTMLTDVNTMNQTPTTLNITNETIKRYYKAKDAGNGKSSIYYLLDSLNRTNRPSSSPNDATTGSETHNYYKNWTETSRGRFFVFNSKTIENNFDLQTTKRIYQSYDNYHQLTSKIVTNANYNTSDSIASEKNSYFYEFNLDSSIYRIFQYNLEKRHKDDGNPDKYTRQQKFYYYDYNEPYGTIAGNDKAYNLKSIKYDEDKTGKTTQQIFAYDKFGNVKFSKLQDPNTYSQIDTNKSSVKYDNIGRFPMKMKDNCGYESLVSINDLGQKTTSDDIQGNHTSYEYDGLGNLSATTYNSNNRKDVFFEWCSSTSDPAIKSGIYPLYKVHNENTRISISGSVDSYSYYDSWSRNVMNKSQYFDTYDGTNVLYSEIYNSTVFYPNGLINILYDTHNLMSPLNTKTMYYDNIGRLEHTNTAFGGIDFYNGLTYNNRTTTTKYDCKDGTSQNRLSTDRTIDAAGNFVSKTDALNNTVSATYYHNGQIHTINGVTFEYDNIGRKTKMIDPDAGTIEYSYNIFGDLVSEIHDNISKKEIVYDQNRRISVVYNYKYVSVNNYTLESTISYVYNEIGDIDNNGIDDDGIPTNGLGQIKQMRYETNPTSVDQTIDFTYNNKGLLTDRIETITEQGKDPIVFKYKYEYDIFGRLHFKTLPSITISGGYGIKLEYVYNNLDQIIEINKYNGTGYDHVWRETASDIYGKPKQTTVGKFNYITTDYVYNDQQRLASKTTKNAIDNTEKEKWQFSWNAYTGNLTTRDYSATGINTYEENYDYDNLDRLMVSNKGSVTNVDDIDLSGNNIESKQKAGEYFTNYEYNSSDSRFADKGASDNAVKQIEVQSLHQIPTNSNIKMDNQLLTYTSFNRIETITETIPKIGTIPGTVLATKTFYYGSDGQRILMVSKEDGTEVRRKYYSGEFEYTVDPSNNKKEVSYITAPTGLVAADVNCSNQSTVDTLYYILTDQLGSITQLLDYYVDQQSNTIKLRSRGKFTYDAWGRLRDLTQTPDVYDITYIRPAFDILERGYCGHEHLLDHDIINMNGRIYDPVTAQFMQADNYIQTPENYMGYNRYAYCRNNPFKFTDPSGEQFVTHRGEEDGIDFSWCHSGMYSPTISPNACEVVYDYCIIRTYTAPDGSSVITKSYGRGGKTDISNQLIQDHAELQDKNNNPSMGNNIFYNMCNNICNGLVRIGNITKYPLDENHGYYYSLKVGGGIFGMDPAKGVNQSFSYSADWKIDDSWSIGVGCNLGDGAFGISFTNSDNNYTFSIGVTNLYDYSGSLDYFEGKIEKKDGVSFQCGSYMSIPWYQMTYVFTGECFSQYYLGPYVQEGLEATETFIFENGFAIIP